MAASCPQAGHLQMFSNDGVTVKPLTAQDCQTDLVARVAQALEDLKNLPPLERGPSDLDFNFINVAPMTFLEQRADKLIFDLDPHSSACGPGTVAYSRERTSRTFNICPYAAFATPLQFQSFIIHEARHLNGPEYHGGIDANHPDDEPHAYPHAICQRGVLKGMWACDATMSNGGSYEIQTELMLKIAATKAIPQRTRDEARMTAVYLLLHHFIELPFEYKTGALLLSENGVLSFYDGVTATEIKRDIPDRDIVGVNNLPTILDPEKGTAINYWNGLEMPALGEFSQLFVGFAPEKQRQVLDVYYGGVKACYLYTHSVYCELVDGNVTLDLPPEIEPTQFAAMDLGEDILSIVTKSGSLYYLPLQKFSYEWSVDDLILNPRLGGFRSVTMIPDGFHAIPGGFNAGIWLDGTLVKFEHPDQQIPVPEFAGQRFKKIMGPFIWSDRLLQL